MLARTGLTALYFPLVFKIEEINSPCWEITTMVCKKIYNEFVKYKTPVFFVLLPPVYQVYEDEFSRYVNMLNIDPASVNLLQPNEILKKKITDYQMHLIDPLLYMRKKAKEGVKMYGKIDKHFNEIGHRILSDYILPDIMKLLIKK